MRTKKPTGLPGKVEIAKRRLRSFVLRQKPFYKAYPYEFAVDMGSANHRGVVSLSHRFFFNRIPKAANSTIVKALPTGVSREREDIDILKDSLTKPSEISKSQVKSLNNFFKFTIVRNPYTRTLSAYLDLILSRGYYEDLCLETFDDFLNFIDRDGLYENIHWAPQTSFLLLPVDEFDMIGRFESLESAVEEISDRAGISINVSRSSHRPHATDAKTKMSKYYSEEAISIVRKLFSDDFDKLGYSTDFPG